MFNKNKKIILWIIVSLIFLIAIFLSTYRLSESPPVWYDEGIFTQVAINMARGHGYSLRIAPNEFIHAEVSTTGLTVTYPISLVFKYFGTTIEYIRFTMVIYILLTVLVAFLVLNRIGGLRVAIYGTLLLTSFAPLYGHGKSVLGEVPGMFFLLLFLYFLHRLEQSRTTSKALYILAGLSAGLCVITKPFFLILIPTMILVGIIFWRMVLRTLSGWLLFTGAFIIPFSIWLYVQFFGQNLINVFNHYSNPNSVDTWQAIIQNTWMFFSELQPAYFLILLSTWSLSLFLRIRNRQLPSIAECIAISFSFVTLIVFLRTVGYYRYFFPAQMLALIFFPYAAFNLASILSEKLRKNKIWLNYAVHVFLIILFIFQFYQTTFNSWVSDYYSSTASSKLEDYFKNFNSDKSIFLYDVPEVVMFMPASVPYYQYLKISEDIIVGQEQQQQIKDGVADLVMVGGLFWSKHQDEFERYQVIPTILSRYVVLERKD